MDIVERVAKIIREAYPGEGYVDATFLGPQFHAREAIAAVLDWLAEAEIDPPITQYEFQAFIAFLRKQVGL